MLTKIRDIISVIIDFIVHIDQHLDFFVTEYGLLTYIILF
jgi:membrane-associated protein